MALYAYFNRIIDLGYFGAVSFKLPQVIFSLSTNTTVISEQCEHGLSSTL